MMQHKLTRHGGSLTSSIMISEEIDSGRLFISPGMLGRTCNVVICRDSLYFMWSVLHVKKSKNISERIPCLWQRARELIKTNEMCRDSLAKNHFEEAYKQVPISGDTMIVKYNLDQRQHLPRNQNSKSVGPNWQDKGNVERMSLRRCKDWVDLCDLESERSLGTRWERGPRDLYDMIVTGVTVAKRHRGHFFPPIIPHLTNSPALPQPVTLHPLGPSLIENKDSRREFRKSECSQMMTTSGWLSQKCSNQEMVRRE